MPAPRAEQGMARIDHDPEEYEAPEVRLERVSHQGALSSLPAPDRVRAHPQRIVVTAGSSGFDHEGRSTTHGPSAASRVAYSRIFWRSWKHEIQTCANCRISGSARPFGSGIANISSLRHKPHSATTAASAKPLDPKSQELKVVTFAVLKTS